MTKFKINDVVVLNNPTMYWSYTLSPSPNLHGEIGIVKSGRCLDGRYVVLHAFADIDEPSEFSEHETEMIKIGEL
jgi:hypothetical protein